MAVTSLAYGRVGFLERLGVRVRKISEVGWKDVVAVRGNEVVVRADPRNRSR